MNQSGFNNEFQIPSNIKKPAKTSQLITVQYAKFIDLISEGEIEGFKSANDSVIIKPSLSVFVRSVSGFKIGVLSKNISFKHAKL